MKAFKLTGKLVAVFSIDEPIFGETPEEALQTWMESKQYSAHALGAPERIAFNNPPSIEELTMILGNNLVIN